MARVGIGDLDDDAYALKNDLDPKTSKAAFFVNGLYTKDSLIGHSTVLNIRATDKNLLIDLYR